MFWVRLNQDMTYPLSDYIYSIPRVFSHKNAGSLLFQLLNLMPSNIYMRID